MEKTPDSEEPNLMCMTNEGPDFRDWAPLLHIHGPYPLRQWALQGCWDHARCGESPASLMWSGILMNV